MQKITDKEFTQLVQFIKNTYGVNLYDKKTLIVGRLQNFLLQSGLKSFGEYYEHVLADRSGKAGEDLINRLTTNHTFFMREEQHFSYFAQIILPYLAERERRTKDLRIWSAGCSSGQEPYTLAMVIDNFFGLEKNNWDSRILATDISTKVLDIALERKYSNEQLNHLPKSWQKKYFRKVDAETNVVSDGIAKDVIFRKFNLVSPVFPFKKKFHVIFCRNVMIYFDAATKRDLINKFYDMTEEGGYLFIGHSETVNRVETNYKYIMPAVYRKE